MTERPHNTLAESDRERGQNDHFLSREDCDRMEMRVMAGGCTDRDFRTLMDSHEALRTALTTPSSGATTPSNAPEAGSSALLVEVHYRKTPFTEGDHGRVRTVVVPGLKRADVLVINTRDAEFSREGA